jgi:sugar/nucleoside kinase (ribokinase family)
MTDRFHVVGIGNALVENGVEKGIMTLIGTERAAELYGRMGPATEISGGSGANTIAGLAMLGSRAAYVGKVRDDQLGAIFAHDIRAQGAVFETPMAPKDAADETGRCMVLVSPDGERSMSTYLGVSEHLAPADIDEGMMARADWLYLEGYRFDGPDSHEAFARAVAACKRGGGRACATLSDPFCVDRHRDAFRRMIRDDLDLLFANEHEIMSLYRAATLEGALDACAAEVRFAAVTVGPRGAWVIEDGERVLVPTEPVEVVDATGAGDLFAAGFLHGLGQGRDPRVCARMGCVAAGEIIGHVGARPQVDLKALMARKGL